MRLIQQYEQLRAERSGRVWRLLASDNAAWVMAVLQSVFGPEDRTVASSALTERVQRALAELQAHGVEIARNAPAYTAEWLAAGWLVRRLPEQASEEVYEISAEASAAIRFASGLAQPRAAATQTRLAIVMDQIVKLAERTDPNPESRVRTLLAQREEIDAQIEQARAGRYEPLPTERALEQAREVLAQAGELLADFRNVRDRFETLHRGLRERLMDTSGARAEVLEQLFAGVDLISESDAGRTFNAFWRFLTDPRQLAAFSAAISEIAGREVFAPLSPTERRALTGLTASLLAESNVVMGTLQQFSRSLKSFVQSREFQQQQRLMGLVRSAQQLALATRESLRPTREVGLRLALSTSQVRSISQATLLDPATLAVRTEITDAKADPTPLGELAAQLRLSDIDMRRLRANVRQVLAERSQATIGQVLARFPADQGVASVVGYLALGVRAGIQAEADRTPAEPVAWVGMDGVPRSGQVPLIFFTRERAALLERADVPTA